MDNGKCMVSIFTDEVLKKLYYKNALKLFPSIDKKLFE